MGVVEAIIAKVTADPVSIAVAVLVVVLLLLVANRRQPGSGGDNVLRPVRAQDKAMQRRGVQYRDLLIQSIKQLSPNVKRFRVALPSPSESLGRHGHLSVVAHIDGQRVVRPYTPVTPPWQKGYFDLVIKEYDYGTLTPHLFKLSEGDVLSVRGPYGGIKYQANEVPKMLFVGAGTGLTPLLQAITIALKLENDDTELVFVFQNRTADDVIMREYIERLDAQHARLTVAFVLSQPPDDWCAASPTKNFAGYVTPALLRRVSGGGLESAKAAVCGPPGFNKAMGTHLKGLGVENVRLL